MGRRINAGWSNSGRRIRTNISVHVSWRTRTIRLFGYTGIGPFKVITCYFIFCRMTIRLFFLDCIQRFDMIWKFTHPMRDEYKWQRPLLQKVCWHLRVSWPRYWFKWWKAQIQMDCWTTIAIRANIKICEYFKMIKMCCAVEFSKGKTVLHWNTFLLFFFQFEVVAKVYINADF